MNRARCTLLAVLLSGLMVAAPVLAQAPFLFGVVNNTFTHPEHESLLIKSLSETASADLSFVVVNGIKSATESCSDGLFQQRQELLNLSETALVLSLTAADWVQCNNKNGISIATDRLTHIRDLFFTDATSLGQVTIPVVRQSVVPQFRSYAENARWTSHNTLFATINVPAPNNHWIIDGGRNSEFEDRLIANKDWLTKLFLLANVKKSPGIVIFADADFMTPPATHVSLLHEARDGFIEMRQLLHKLAATYKGRVLLVHSQTGESTTPTITWHNTIGLVGTQPAWLAIEVNSASSTVFALKPLQDIPSLQPAPPVPPEVSSPPP